jgi:hypothetical protein
MKKLFDYDSVIEVDWNDPVGQVESIVRHFDQYQELIERNFETVCSLHQPRNTVAKINELVAACLGAARVGAGVES